VVLLRVNIVFKQSTMENKTEVFISFAAEGARQKYFLKGQSLDITSSFEYTDMSIKEKTNSDWKTNVRTKIKNCDGVIVLVSTHSLNSSKQQWEIQCAREEGKTIYGIYDFKNEGTSLVEMNMKAWQWDGIKNFIDVL
jgi:hypothetical protein